MFGIIRFRFCAEVKEEILLKDGSLIVTPVVRNGKKATVGYKPEIWKEWIDSE